MVISQLLQKMRFMNIGIVMIYLLLKSKIYTLVFANHAERV